MVNYKYQKYIQNKRIIHNSNYTQLYMLNKYNF